MSDNKFTVKFDEALDNYVIKEGDKQIEINHDRLTKIMKVLCETQTARDALRYFIDCVEDGIDV